MSQQTITTKEQARQELLKLFDEHNVAERNLIAYERGIQDYVLQFERSVDPSLIRLWDTHDMLERRIIELCRHFTEEELDILLDPDSETDSPIH